MNVVGKTKEMICLIIVYRRGPGPDWVWRGGCQIGDGWLCLFIMGMFPLGDFENIAKCIKDTEIGCLNLINNYKRRWQKLKVLSQLSLPLVLWNRMRRAGGEKVVSLFLNSNIGSTIDPSCFLRGWNIYTGCQFGRNGRRNFAELPWVVLGASPSRQYQTWVSHNLHHQIGFLINHGGDGWQRQGNPSP